MSNSRRMVAIVVVPIVVLGAWLAYGPGDYSFEAGAQEAQADRAQDGEQGRQANLTMICTEWV